MRLENACRFTLPDGHVNNQGHDKNNRAKIRMWQSGVMSPELPEFSLISV
jgi:hypothetical protein